MTDKLTDLGIAVRIVPKMLRWPEVAAWDRLRDGVEALRDMLRALNDACQRVEHDHRLQPQEVRRRRIQLGDEALRKLAAFEPLHIAERAVAASINDLETAMQNSLRNALNELHEGIDAARRAVIERCQMRTDRMVH